MGQAHEVQAIVPDARLSDIYMDLSRTATPRALDAGATICTIYSRDIQAHWQSRAFVSELARAGGDAKVATVLPTWLVILNRHTALLPAEMGQNAPGTIILRGGPTVSAFTWMFQQTWRAAHSMTD